MGGEVPAVSGRDVVKTAYAMVSTGPGSDPATSLAAVRPWPSDFPSLSLAEPLLCRTNTSVHQRLVARAPRDLDSGWHVVGTS